MIKNFSDHAANERTFLAWVRTAIAVMAFGFLVERFDLFLRFAPTALATHAGSAERLRFGGLAGLVLMVVGLALVVVAAVRLAKTAREIDDEVVRAGQGARFDIALAVLLFLLGCALVGYLVFNLVGVR